MYFSCRPPGGNPGPAFSTDEAKREEKPHESSGSKSCHVENHVELKIQYLLFLFGSLEGWYLNLS